MSAERIRTLNDQFRSTFHGGKVMMTSGINALDDGVKARILDKVRTFDVFTPDNDPRGEHDFGNFELDGKKVFWKIDLYEECFVKSLLA
jgi:hypothetical protein